MKKHVKSPISFARLALALANDYCSIYVINAEDDSYVEYSPAETIRAGTGIQRKELL